MLLILYLSVIGVDLKGDIYKSSVMLSFFLWTLWVLHYTNIKVLT